MKRLDCEAALNAVNEALDKLESISYSSNASEATELLTRKVKPVLQAELKKTRRID